MEMNDNVFFIIVCILIVMIIYIRVRGKRSVFFFLRKKFCNFSYKKLNGSRKWNDSISLISMGKYF